MGGRDPGGFQVHTVRRAVLITDVRHSSQQFADRPDEAAVRINQDLEAFASVCHEYGGLPVRDRGDGLMMTFEDPRQALLAGIAMQRQAMEANAKRPKGAISLLHRIGAHVGPLSMVRKVVESGFVDLSTEKFTGDTVVVADRLQTYCHPGEVCFSNEMYQAVKDHLEVPVMDLHQGAHKGMSIHAWSTRIDPHWTRPLTVEEQKLREREKELAKLQIEFARDQRHQQADQRRRAYALFAVLGSLIVLLGMWGPDPVRERLSGAWRALAFGPETAVPIRLPETVVASTAPDPPHQSLVVNSRAKQSVSDDPERVRALARIASQRLEALRTLRFGGTDFDRSTPEGQAAADEAVVVSDWLDALSDRISRIGAWSTKRLGRQPGMVSGVSYAVAGVVDQGIELVPTAATASDRVPPNVRVNLRTLGMHRLIRLGQALRVPETSRVRAIIAKWRALR